MTTVDAKSALDSVVMGPTGRGAGSRKSDGLGAPGQSLKQILAAKARIVPNGHAEKAGLARGERKESTKADAFGQTISSLLESRREETQEPAQSQSDPPLPQAAVLNSPVAAFVQSQVHSCSSEPARVGLQSGAARSVAETAGAANLSTENSQESGDLSTQQLNAPDDGPAVPVSPAVTTETIDGDGEIASLRPATDARVTVVAQEAHWGFAPSAQKFSSRAVEGLTFSAFESLPKNAKAGDVKGEAIRDIPRTESRSALGAASSNIILQQTTGDQAGALMSGHSGGANRRDGREGATPVAKQPFETQVEGGLKTTNIHGIGQDVKPLAQQIAPQVLNALDQASRPAMSQSPDGSPHTVLRRLEIKLDPEHLGEVQIKLSLTANTLGINIAAANRETAAMLDSERGKIDNVLRDAGFDVADYTVSVASSGASAEVSLVASAPTPSSSPGQTSAQSSGTPSQSSFLGASGDPGSGRHERNHESRHPNSQSGASTQTMNTKRDEAVYV